MKNDDYLIIDDIIEIVPRTPRTDQEQEQSENLIELILNSLIRK